MVAEEPEFLLERDVHFATREQANAVLFRELRPDLIGVETEKRRGAGVENLKRLAAAKLAQGREFDAPRQIDNARPDKQPACPVVLLPVFSCLRLSRLQREMLSADYHASRAVRERWIWQSSVSTLIWLT